MSLMHLSLCRKLKLLDLKPTITLIQLADCSTRRPVDILEDVLVNVGEFVIPCDFFIMDMDESSHVLIILGRPFLATVGAKIDRQAGTISFQMCGEMVDLCFSPPTPPSVPVIPSPPVASVDIGPPDAVFWIDVFDGDGGTRMRSVGSSDCPS